MRYVKYSEMVGLYRFFPIRFGVVFVADFLRKLWTSASTRSQRGLQPWTSLWLRRCEGAKLHWLFSSKRLLHRFWFLWSFFQRLIGIYSESTGSTKFQSFRVWVGSPFVLSARLHQRDQGWTAAIHQSLRPLLAIHRVMDVLDIQNCWLTMGYLLVII